MNLTLQYTYLEVDDHEAALAFYRDVLGLEVRNDVALEFGRWVTVGPVDQPDLGIVLSSPSASAGRPPTRRLCGRCWRRDRSPGWSSLPATWTGCSRRYARPAPR